jgi:hypothetical protein
VPDDAIAIFAGANTVQLVDAIEIVERQAGKLERDAVFRCV